MLNIKPRRGDLNDALGLSTECSDRSPLRGLKFSVGALFYKQVTPTGFDPATARCLAGGVLAQDKRKDNRTPRRFATVERAKSREGAYLILEALVYIGVSVLLLSIGSVVMYRCMDSSIALRRNADTISTALQ